MNGSTPTNATAFSLFFFHSAADSKFAAETINCDGFLSVTSKVGLESKENDK